MSQILRTPPGFAYGSCQLCRIVCVQRHFDKNRTLATGLVLVGTGCSHFVYGGLTRLLATTYGWRGAVLLNAATFLQCLPLSWAFRPLNGCTISAAKRTGNSYRVLILGLTGFQYFASTAGQADNSNHVQQTSEPTRSR